jgi:hypothetical protein
LGNTKAHKTRTGTSDLCYNSTMEKDWEELKKDLKDPEYVESFIAAAIQLIINGDSVD